MKTEERRHLIASWLSLHAHGRHRGDRPDFSWVLRKVWNLCDRAPYETLLFISGVLAHDPPKGMLTILAAGPLEGILRKHGLRAVEGIERVARADPRFIPLLAHVWQSSMSEAVWTRLQRVRERRTPAASRDSTRSCESRTVAPAPSLSR